MNGVLCINCKYRSHPCGGVGPEFCDCQHPNIGKDNYIWFMNESECPGKEIISTVQKEKL
jgi:hypothetical protein